MLTLWRPFGELHRWRQFNDFFSRDLGNAERIGFSPAVDIDENENQIILQADLPGVAEKDIEVKVHDGVLLLSGVRQEEKEENEKGFLYRERSSGSFHRQFRLGPQVDANGIEASFNNGVLTVTLPKKAEAQPRQIPVATN